MVKVFDGSYTQVEFASLDFVNSLEFDYRRGGAEEDHLAEPSWLPNFLARWDLAGAPAPTAAEQERLVALRALLRRLVDRLAAEQPVPADDIAELNGFLADAPLTRRLERADGGFALRQEPLARDWNWVLAEIAASFAEILTRHDLRRLRVCENAECRWAFYDASRSRTKRWCDDASCGNLHKVRRFRERRRAAKTTPAGVEAGEGEDGSGANEHAHGRARSDGAG